MPVYFAVFSNTRIILYCAETPVQKLDRPFSGERHEREKVNADAANLHAVGKDKSKQTILRVNSHLKKRRYRKWQILKMK